MSLSARAEPDNARALGHARLVIGGANAAAVAGGYRIRREGYQASNLGLRGWQVSEEILRPVMVLEESAGTILILGPRMTRNMEPGPVHLVLPGLGEVALFWPDSIEVFDGELPPDPIMPIEPPARLVTRAAPPAESPSDATIIMRPPTQTPTPTPLPATMPVPTKTPVALYAGGGLLALLLIAAAAWWFLVQGETAPPVAPPAPPPIIIMPTPNALPPVAPQAPSRPPAPAPEPAPNPPAAQNWLHGTDRLSPRDVVGSATSPADILAVARRRQANGRHDDALVLMEEAASRAHAPAMTALGRLYDPIGFVPGTPFRTPDPRAAARQYAEGERAGDAAAAPLRAALRAWLEQQANGGNALAGTTLREFW